MEKVFHLLLIILIVSAFDKNSIRKGKQDTVDKVGFHLLRYIYSSLVPRVKYLAPHI